MTFEEWRKDYYMSAGEKRHAKAAWDHQQQEIDSLKETLHLLKSPENAKRLLESIERAEQGDTMEFDPRL